MPKMKTNRTAYKKLLVRGSGSVKKAQANTSHNTGKKSNKRMRQLRKRVNVDSANLSGVKGMLPYAGKA